MRFPSQTLHIWLLIPALATYLSAQWPTSGFSVLDLEATSARILVEHHGADTITLRSADGRETALVRKGDGPLEFLNIKDLQPSSQYELTCGSSTTSIRTPAKDQQHWRLAIVGHTGGTHSNRREVPQMLVGQIAGLRPDGVIHAGDAVYNCTPDTIRQEFLHLMDPVMRHVPTWIAPGNHECGYPADRPDYRTFRTTLPYPFASLDGASDGPPCYVVQRGSLRLLFLTYFHKALLPGTPQHTWLLEQLEQNSTPFTALVIGMGQSTFLEKDQVLASLPADKIDLLIGGDGEGLSLDTKGPIPILFNGSEGSRPSPYSVLEVTPHALILNCFGGPRSSLLHHLVIRDKTLYPVKSNVLASLAAGTIRGAQLDPVTGEILPDKKEELIAITSAPLKDTKEPVRGLQVVVSAKPMDPNGVPKTTAFYLRWRPRNGKGRSLTYRSQPFFVPLNNQPMILHMPMPELGKELSPNLVGLIIYKEKLNLAGFRVHHASLY